VTRDHPTTAAAVARAAGIPVDGVMTGADLARMTESERVRRAAETTVFARVSPEQKLRIVEALRAAGNVVAMTGDGTNDTAAIRMADVGIGVAAPGTSAASSSARSAADMVIAGADVRRIHDAMVGCTPIGPAAWSVVIASAAAGTLAAALAPRFLAAPA
jgi:cation-transporting ATPase I